MVLHIVGSTASADAVAVAVQSNTPVLLWGEPGTGKTAFVRSLASGLGWPCEIIIAAIHEPADFAGLPVVRETGVEFVPPAWAVRLARAGRGILFCDEISCAPPAVQAGLLRVIHERVVGELTLSGISMVAAANPPDQAAGGWDLAAPLANRFCHLDWRLEPEAWVSGMLAGWPTPAIPRLPEGWEAGVPAARALMAAFIRARPHLLLQVPKEEDRAGRAWPSGRAWDDMAARLWAAGNAAGVGRDVLALLVCGCVGDGPGLEFLSWQEKLDLPDPEELLANPASFRLPDRGDKTFAVLSAVVAAAVGRLDGGRWMAAWEILAKAAEEGAADVAAASARALAQARRPDLPLPVEQVRAFLPVLRGV